TSGAGARCTAATDYLAARTVPDPDPVATAGQGLRYDYTYDAASDVTGRTRSTGWVQAAGVEAGSAETGAAATAGPIADVAGDTAGARDTAAGTAGLGAAAGPVAAVTTTYGYDTLRRLTSSSTSDGTQGAYTYDQAGNLTSWSSTSAEHAVTWASTFDAANHLVAADLTDTGRAAAVRYSLDANGSRVGASVTGDALLSRGLTMQATYGADGRVATYTANGASTAYGYDGLGRAVSTATSESTGIASTSWVFDGTAPVAGVSEAGAQVALVRDSLGDVVIQVDERLAATTDGASRWALVDALGSVVAQASAASGATSITQLVSYADYGSVGQETSGWASVVGYSGQVSDASTGSVGYYQRLYDPVSGTWASRDAWAGLLVAPGTLNGFAFVVGNPTSMVDVLGFSANLIDGQWGSPQAARRGAQAARSMKQTQTATKAATNIFGITRAGPFTTGYVTNKQAAAANKSTASKSAARATSQARGPQSTVTQRHQGFWEREFDFDWGTLAAGVVNILWGGLSLGMGIETMLAGGAATATGIGALVGIPAVFIGMYKVVTGGAKVARGVRQVNEALSVPCENSCDAGSNVGRFLTRVVPGGQVLYKAGWLDWLGGMP
ncbi:MAG TPA: RHS repeat-associated core domain-containing protein, partial [Cellulomonas sp.]